MSQKMHDYLHDPVTGRTLTRQERWARLGQQFAEQKPSQLPVPSGTLAERQRQRHETSLLRQELAAQVAAEAAANKPKGNPFASRIADLQAKLEWVVPTERGGIERRLSALREAAAAWESNRAKAERRATFEASEDFQRMREHYEATLRLRDNGHVELSDHEHLLLAAITTSTAYLSPVEQCNAYFAAVRAVEEKQNAREIERFAAAEQAAVKTSTEFATQKARVDASNDRLAELGGGDAS